MASSRSINNALIRSLGRCANPVYVLDDERVIRYANEALSAWLAVDLEEIVGTRCDYHSRDQHSKPEQIAARLCPPPEVFAGQRAVGQIACVKDDGSLVYRDADFIPLFGGDEAPTSIFVVVESNDQLASNRTSSERGYDPTALHHHLQELRNKIRSRYRIDRLIGESSRMQRVRDQVDAAIASQARVVVVGPQGSGCEHVARTIFFGPNVKHDSALVPVDCQLMDAELLQATITNLRAQVETSHDVRLGTLLLLSADELSGDAQQELLGFLSLPSVEFTIISTARRSLLELAREGEFLPDLAHALSTMEIELPALSERPEDIPVLCQAALEEFNAQGDKQLSGFSEEVLEQLVAYRWPGNVDQLFEYVGEACESADGLLVTMTDLPRAIGVLVSADDLPARKNDAVVLDDLLADIEAELLKRALARAKGNKTKAAELLGISRARLHRRLEQLALAEDVDSSTHSDARNG
jgi:transcriptional regulator of acetoin/glycerol metabolism